MEKHTGIQRHTATLPVLRIHKKDISFKPHLNIRKDTKMVYVFNISLILKLANIEKM